MKIFLVLLTTFFAADTTFARVIDSFRFGATFFRTVSTPVPNNENVSGVNPNTVNMPANGQGSVGFSIGSLNTGVDFVFDVHASGGTTEYALSFETQNSNLMPWTGYKIQIGRGVGENFQLGGASVPELQLPDFDFSQFDPFPTANRFASVSTSPYEIVFSSGQVPSHALPPFNASPSQLTHRTTRASTSIRISLCGTLLSPNPPHLLYLQSEEFALGRFARPKNLPSI